MLKRQAARTTAGWARRGVLVLCVVACVIVCSVCYSFVVLKFNSISFSLTESEAESYVMLAKIMRAN
jgi:hypothetical protein